MANAERAAGRMRINTSAPCFNHILASARPDILALYPAVPLDIVQTDAVVDLLAEPINVAVRAEPMKSSCLASRKLGATR